MLQNPGFELDWEVDKSHRCLLFAPDGTPLGEQEVGNIFTPSKWLTWFVHDPGTWDQPEVRDAWAHEPYDPRRVHSGEKATLLFTYERKHWAGFLQQVPAMPGDVLRLFAWAHAWSNHGHPDVSPHPDDPYWSEGKPLVGYNEVILYEDDIPPLNKEPQNDAIGNFCFSVGIDPTGGTNPLADTVAWGEPAWSYNAHHRLPEATATAQADTVTVFLRSKTLWPFTHNDAYWDDVELAIVKPPAPPTSYRRNYVLFNPNVNGRWLVALFPTWERFDVAIGKSRDAAGIEGPAERNVIAVNPPDDLETWLAENYPGVNYYQVSANIMNVERLVRQVLREIYEEEPPTNQPPTVDAGPDQTVVLPATAILSGTVTDDGLPSPPGAVAVSWSQESGPGVAIFLGADTVDATVSFTEPGTYTLRLTADDGELTASDDVTVTVEDEAPPEMPPWAGMIPVTLHVQKPVAPPDDYGDLEFVRDVQPAGYKTVGYMEHLQLIKAVSPNTVTIYRQFVDDQGQYWDVDPQQGAREFLYTFLDSLNGLRDYVDLVEGLNEIGVPEEIARLAEWYWWFAEALIEEGLPAKPLMLSIPVGNPKHPEESGLAHIEEMLPAVAKAVELGGAIGYHGYHRVHNGAVDPPWDSNWYNYAGRCLESWDPVFNSHGLFPNYVISEAGAFLNALAGWKHPEVFDGNWDLYAQSLLELRDRINAWNTAHDHRCIGYTLFTYLPPGQGWKDYNLYGYARAMAEALTGGPVGGPTMHTRIRKLLARIGLEDIGRDVAKGSSIKEY